MTHLARRVAAGCHQDRVDSLVAEFAFFGVLSTFPGLLVVAALIGLLWLYLLALILLVGGELNGVLHRDREPGTRVAPPG
jgi:uncharacterized BrkB/YihY/UPF0761 family membrane protein